MFWMATMNPGKKSRKLSRRRRKLTAWQQAVKKFGGVKAAVAAKRKGKLGGATILGAKRRGRPLVLFGNKSRSVGSRRRRRGRSGTSVVVRSSQMAKTRRRGRRRARRNDWPGQPIRHRRAAKLGWRRRKSGRKYRRNAILPTAWNPRRRSRRIRRNPVVPVSWNPRRKSRRSRRYRSNPRRSHRRSRHYRRNPVLSSLSLNPNGAVGGIMSRAGSFVDITFWTETALPASAGFLGSKVVGGFINGAVGPTLAGFTGPKGAPFIRIASDAVGASLLSWGVGRFVSKKMGDAVFLGGVVGVAHSLLRELLGGTAIASAIGLSGFGEDLSEKMKQAVAARMQAELSGYGMGTYLTQNFSGGVGEFVTDAALRNGSNYSATPSGSLRDYDPTNNDTVL